MRTGSLHRISWTPFSSATSLQASPPQVVRTQEPPTSRLRDRFRAVGCLCSTVRIMRVHYQPKRSARTLDRRGPCRHRPSAASTQGALRQQQKPFNAGHHAHMHRQYPTSPFNSQRTADCGGVQFRPTRATGLEAPPAQEARTPVGQLRPATQEEVRDCTRLEGRNVSVQARGIADRGKINETIVLLRLECRLPLASDKTLYVRIARGS